jgi:hypothetical protein
VREDVKFVIANSSQDSPCDLRRVHALIGVVNGVRAFLPHMRAHGEGGHIVNPGVVA